LETRELFYIPKTKSAIIRLHQPSLLPLDSTKVRTFADGGYTTLFKLWVERDFPLAHPYYPVCKDKKTGSVFPCEMLYVRH